MVCSTWALGLPLPAAGRSGRWLTHPGAKAPVLSLLRDSGEHTGAGGSGLWPHGASGGEDPVGYPQRLQWGLLQSREGPESPWWTLQVPSLKRRGGRGQDPGQHSPWAALAP